MENSKQITNSGGQKYSGLGGWLILFGWMPLVIGGLTSLLSISFFIDPDSSFQFIISKQILQSTAVYHTVIYIGLVGNMILFLLYAWTFIKRERRWVRISIIWFLFYLVWDILITTVFILSIPPEDGITLSFSYYNSTYASIIPTIVFVVYLYKSKRVKNTFVQ
jgi:hypothetical protein